MQTIQQRIRRRKVLHVKCGTVARGGGRRGLASLELAIFLPLYAAALMILFTIFSFARTRNEVTMQARFAAWDRVDDLGPETETLSDTGDTQRLGLILDNSQDPELGLVSSQVEADADNWHKPLQLLTRMEHSHAFLTDPWDYRTIPFETKQEHDRLKLDQRVRVFGRFSIRTFMSLSAFQGGGGVSMRELNDARRQAQQRIQQLQNDVRRKLAAISQQIQRIKANIARLENQDPVDETAVAQARDELRDAEREYGQYEANLQQLNRAAAYASF